LLAEKVSGREQMDSMVSSAEIFAEGHSEGKQWLNFRNCR
jgi:hypothetical protein